VIRKELANPDILPENVWNMDETGVLLGHAATVTMLVLYTAWTPDAIREPE
jgi:hypothetical protein